MTSRLSRLARPLLAFTALIALTGAGVARDVAAPGEHADSVAGDRRPVVIIVHGRGELPGDSAAALATWRRALKSGIATLAGDSLLRDDDIRTAWYADALDPLAPAVCDAASRATSSDSARRSGDEGLRAFFAAVGEGLTATLDMLDGYARDEARALAGDFLFIGNPVRRCAAETQLARALASAKRDSRPVILVAHSFGSLLSYGYLRSPQPDDSSRTTVRHFVTIGSLLGAPGVRTMLLGDTASRATRPMVVERWTNIVDPRDALAYPITFALGADSSAARPTENLTTGAHAPNEDAHYIGRYLRDPVTVRSVAGAWCRALGERALPERMPESCRTFAGGR
jgi:alpha-beta hydrolase superfamily lysophospholipase